MKKIAMVAGEISGDILGGAILSALCPRIPEASFYGIGGGRMAEHGFVSKWPMEKLAVNGFFEVFAHFWEIKNIRNSLRDTVIADHPDVFIGIDAPEFNLGLEVQLRQAGIKTVHVVGPSIWAWRSGRIKTIAKAVSRILVLFPFEETIYQKAGIPVTCIGHPLAEAIPMQADMAGARQELQLDSDKPVIAILPGSRMSELKYHTASFIEAARILLEREPSLQFVIPMAGERQDTYFKQLLKENRLDQLPLKIILGQSQKAIAAADAVLVASGTATLEVALLKKPMVIGYRMMWGTWQIARRVVKPPVGLPNILAGEMIVPELFQYDATGQKLADALWYQLTDETNRRNLHQRFTDMHHSLLRNMAQTSAEAILDVIQNG